MPEIVLDAQLGRVSGTRRRPAACAGDGRCPASSTATATEPVSVAVDGPGPAPRPDRRAGPNALLTLQVGVRALPDARP